ncbi:MAG: hypothetical protein HYY33_06275 [Chloroflexi bacterium]|nr:hypothetical protein [Chloroflexota bacterium]
MAQKAARVAVRFGVADEDGVTVRLAVAVNVGVGEALTAPSVGRGVALGGSVGPTPA